MTDTRQNQRGPSRDNLPIPNEAYAGPVLYDIGERLLTGDPLFGGKLSPSRIDLVEGVGNVLAAHQQDGSSVNASRSDFGVWSA